MVRRVLFVGVITAAILGVALGVFGLNTLRAWLGWSVVTYTPEALAVTLRPAYGITQPAGAGPFPTALLLSGCDGPKDNLTRLAADLAEVGWASIVVDSHSPRGLETADQWRLVCAGQFLTGSERAADIAVAVDDARRMAFVDPDRLALIGASHGGWAILDLLALLDRGEQSPILKAWPASVLNGGLEGVRAAVLFYPYCGGLSRAAEDGWRARPPLLFVLVESDRIADEADCLALAEQQRAAGARVDVEVFDGVTHGFDQAEKAPMSALAYHPEAAERAIASTLAFLATTAPP